MKRELPSRDFASETVVGRHRIFEFYAAFRHGLNDLFGDAQHVFGLGREPVAVVDAPPDEPDDLIPGKQYELPCLLRQRDFMVDQVVADLLAAGHAVGNEPVPLLPAAHRERVFEFVGIHLGDVFGYAEALDIVDVAQLEVEHRVAAVAAPGSGLP